MTFGAISGTVPPRQPPDYDFSHMMPFLEVLMAPQEFKKKLEEMTFYNKENQNRYDVLVKLESKVNQEFEKTVDQILKLEHMQQKLNNLQVASDKKLAEANDAHTKARLEKAELEKLRSNVEQREKSVSEREEALEKAKATLKAQFA
jgi:hypothetical protein